MFLGRDQINVQDARSFCQLLSTLHDKTTVIHVIADEIDTSNLEDPFSNSVQIKHCLNACDQFEWGDHTFVAKIKDEKSDNKHQIV